MLHSFKNIATTETNKTNDTFCSNIIVEYLNPHCDMNDKDEKQQQAQAEVINKMGNKEEFELKIKEMANNTSYDWIVPIMAIDDYESSLFSNNR